MKLMPKHNFQSNQQTNRINAKRHVIRSQNRKHQDKTIKKINHLIITKMAISKFKYANTIDIDIILQREARLRLED